MCLIEPKPVQTALWDGIQNDIKASAADESVPEIDRRQLRNLLARWDVTSALTTDDIVEALMTRCVDVDEPVLRHMLAGKLSEVVQKFAGDMTGESGLAALGLMSLSALE